MNIGDVNVGDVVTGTTTDWVVSERIGQVEQIFYRCWGRRRHCVHSVQVSHLIMLRKNRSLKLVLVWNAATGRWTNKLNRAAKYHIQYEIEC